MSARANQETGSIADKLDMKNCRAKLVGVVLLAIATVRVGAQAGSESDAKSTILALEHAWNQAEAFKDLKALDALFDNAMIYVDFDGSVMTKGELLSRVKAAHLEQVVTESESAQLFGQTAIVTGTYRSSEFTNGKAVVRRGRFIDTWVWRSSTWVCVAAQATPILH